MQIRVPSLSALAATLWLVAALDGQNLPVAHPRARMLQSLDESATVTLNGNVHPLAKAATSGVSDLADGGTPMEHMILHLKGDSTQEEQLVQLIAQQKDPASPLYHHYLAPEEFGAQFGVEQSDIAKVTAWLQSHGFTIDGIPASNKAIVFSGTASQVANAFKTEIRTFTVAGQRHIANTTDPQIPLALAEVVAGIVQLHDFQTAHKVTKLTPVSKAQFANPLYTNSTGHYLAPPDFSVIYNTNPLYASGVDGSGQSIAVIARSNIQVSDITTFRSMFGLPANDPQIVLVTNDPGFSPGNVVETTLDTEWAGAVAPKAAIKVVIGQCTNTADGVVEAELYAVNHNTAPIITVSYGQCEAVMGSSQSAFYSALWQQAAAQGQTVIVSSGDSGAAGCNFVSDTSASVTGVNGLCSSPYSTCIGGTQFAEGSNPGQYWLPGNSASNGSATGYIPETVWNESSVPNSGLAAGGGGASIVFAKPSWQTGIGVPADGKRDVPDVSLSAANHDGYLVYEYGSSETNIFSAGGTSFSAPAFAGIVALINQKAGTPQGLINPTLYALAAKQAAGGAAVFHDITTGNNSVPGVTGFSATTGYDLASGLGSVDAAMLVNHWADGAPAINLTAATGTLTVTDGQTVRLPLTVVASAALKSAVTFSVSGAPTGVTATFAPATLAAPGSGATTLSLAASSSTATGSYKITITASGGGQTSSIGIPLTVGSATFLLLTDKTQLSLPASTSTKVAVTTTAQTGFSAALAFTLSGAPSGVTATLSAQSVASPGTGALTLTVANASATPGNYPLTITGTGGNRTVTAIIALTIPTFTVTSPSSYYLTTEGGSVTIPVTVTPQTGFTAPIAMSAPNYLPSGVTIAFSPASINGAAASSATNLTLTVAKTVANGDYPFMIYGKGGGVTVSDYVHLLVGVTASCTLWVYDSSMSTFTIQVTAGQSNTGSAVCLWPQGTFNGPLSVAFNSVPSGLTVQSLQPLVAGGTTSSVGVSAAQNMAAGTYNFNIVGSQGTFTTHFGVTVAVTANSFSLAAAQNALSIPVGANASLSVTTKHNGIFNSPVSLVWSGLPAGVTTTLAKSAVSAPGDGTVATAFTVAASAKPGTYTATLTATGASQTQTVPVTLTVAPPSCQLGVTYPSASQLSLFAGQTGSVQVACSSAVGTFAAPLSLSVTGAPTGVTVTVPSSMALGTNAAIQVTTPLSLGATTLSLKLTATSGSFTQTVPISVTVAASNFIILAASSALTISQATTAQLSISSLHQGIFNSPIALSWSGLPSGVTAALSKSTLAAPGDGSVTTTFTVTSNAATGTYTPTLVASGGGLTQSVPVKLTVAPPPSCTAAVTYPSSASSLVVTAGASASATVSCNSPLGVFSGPLSLTLTGAPTGVATTMTATTMTPGSNITVQVTPAASMSSTTFSLSLLMKSGTFAATLPVAVTVNANRFTLTSLTAALSIKAGTTGQVTVSSAHLGVFNSALRLSWTLPAGVTASYSASVPAPGDATLVTTFTVAATAKVGTYNATLSATGGGLSQTLAVPLTIASK